MTRPPVPSARPLVPPDIHAEGFQQVRQAHRQELAEDYVELIDDLLRDGGEARQVDIAARLGVAQPTVARMLKRLDAQGLVALRRYRGIALTDAGRLLAESSRRRHQLCESVLLALGVGRDAARRDAEGMEHHVSEETLQAFSRFLAQRQREKK